MRPILNAFTVDVEDYFQVSGFEKDIPRSQWAHIESRVVTNTHRILRLLDRYSVRGTFFILGWVAKKYPQLVRDIHRSGHQVGSHGFWHRLVYEQTPEQFRDDLRQSRDLLADLAGQRVTLYRAPSFSITRDSLWALRILVEEGFEVDSSVFPTRHDRYGIPQAEPTIHVIDTQAGPIHEFPPSVLKVGRHRLPVAGGGYFRLFPYRWTRFCVSRVNRSISHPFMFYVHPWEIDPDQPRMRAGTPLGRFRHYVNLSRTERKLERLLQDFRFGRVCDVIRPSKTATDNSGDAQRHINVPT